MKKKQSHRKKHIAPEFHIVSSVDKLYVEKEVEGFPALLNDLLCPPIEEKISINPFKQLQITKQASTLKRRAAALFRSKEVSEIIGQLESKIREGTFAFHSSMNLEADLVRIIFA